MEKWRSFTNSLRSMLKLVHDVVWQFNNLACSCGLMFVWPGSVRFGYQREQNYIEIVLKYVF